MKRFISVLLTVILILSTVSVIIAANVNAIAEVDVSSLKLIYNNYHNINNLVNPIANVQKLTSVSSANLKNLSVAYIDLTAGIDAKSAYQACVNANVLPTFYITTNAQADSVATAITAVGKTDVNVISNSTSVLTYMRAKNNKVRTGLTLNIASEMTDGTLSISEANSIRKKVRSAPATFIVIDSKYATKQSVNALQEFALAVWVTVSSTSGTDAFRSEAIKVITTGAHGIISSSASAISEIISNDFVPNSFTRVSYTIGHAGNYDIAEENTMESFIAAYENGCTFLELDTGITSDGVVVLLHDNTLNRTTNYTGNKNIWEMTWAEVQQYNVIDTKTKVDTGKPIPKFEELLAWGQDKDIKFFVEFKSSAFNVITEGMKLIQKYDMTDQCVFLSFYNNCINTVLTAENGVSTSRIFFTEDTKTGNSTYADSLVSLDFHITEAQGAKSTISPPRYDTIGNTLNNVITHDYMQAATDRGMTVWPWTYDTKSANDAFFAVVDGMTMVNAQDYKDMVKLAYSSGLTMFVGQTYNGGAVTAETYSGGTFSVSGADTVVSVVSGDCVTVKDGKLVALKEGTASVIFGCKTTSYMGSPYVIYTEPVTVNVDNGVASVLESLVAQAKTATINSLSESDLQKLREYTNKAEELIKTNSKDSDEISATATAISKLIDKFIVLTYTATAPNYANTTFADDGKRLIDGAKAFYCGNDIGYSAWQKTANGVVEITLKYNTSVTRDIFKAYFAGDEWGVNVPSNMSVSYSDNGSSWTKINVSTKKTQTLDSTAQSDGIWDLWTYSVTASAPITANYFKFTITPNGNFIWVDEVEALNSSDDLIYVSKLDQRITAGDCNIFTPAMNGASQQEANTTYTFNILAKYDAKYDAYVITNKNVNTANGLSIKSDEILIAVHDWETNVGKEQNPVYGSKKNTDLAINCNVGQYIEFYGVDIDNRKLGVAPSFRFVDKLEPIAKLGDVNQDGKIDSLDYLLVKRSCFKTYELEDVERVCADIDKNGTIDSADYLLIKRVCFNTYTIE